MSARAPRILVVEDDPTLGSSLERSLRRLGYEVELVANGQDALRRALETAPQVALVDIRLPGLDGHTLTRRLLASGLNIAVVVMSAHGQMDDVVDALRNGATDYLKKPWAPSELIAAVARGIEAATQREETAPGVAAAPHAASTAPAAAETTKSFSDVLARLRDGEIKIPAVPSIILQLRSKLRDPSASVEEIITLISSEQTMAAQVLRLCNTAQYGRRGGRTNDLRTALSRIGMRQTENLVETIFMHGCYQIEHPELRELQMDVWRHSLAIGVSMRALAELCISAVGLSPEAAYLAGLLGDVGASFLASLICEKHGSRVVLAPAVEFIKQHHQEMGGLVLFAWNADPLVVKVAQSHHAVAPPAPPDSHFAISVVGQALARTISRAPDRTNPHDTQTALVERCLSELRVSESMLDRLASPLADELAELLAAAAPA